MWETVAECSEVSLRFAGRCVAVFLYFCYCERVCFRRPPAALSHSKAGTALFSWQDHHFLVQGRSGVGVGTTLLLFVCVYVDSGTIYSSLVPVLYSTYFQALDSQQEPTTMNTTAAVEVAGEKGARGGERSGRRRAYEDDNSTPV